MVKKNPDVYPTFAEQYTDETVMNNSLIVECGDRSRFIGYDDIYVQEADIYSYSYNTSFDGEGAKENMETESLSLLTVDAIPKDADCVIIYAPERLREVKTIYH